MDPRRFDTLAKSLSGTNTRRRLMGLVAALPLAGALGGLLGEEGVDGQGSGAGVGGGGGRRRRRRGRHHPGQDKKNRKGKRRHRRNGCTPTTCAAEGKTCGSIADGCGTTLDCGACTGTETCGGGGTANVCGCTRQCSGNICGANDACGGICQTGTCDGGKTCQGGTCACPTTACTGGKQRDPLTCQCVCPNGTTDCSGTCYANGALCGGCAICPTFSPRCLDFGEGYGWLCVPVGGGGTTPPTPIS